MAVLEFVADAVISRLLLVTVHAIVVHQQSQTISLVYTVSRKL